MSFSITKNISNFGFGYTFCKIFNKIMLKMTKKQCFQENIFKINLKYLNKHYASILINNEKEESIPKDYKIFVFWWQGINEQTPEIVKCCINSMKQNYADHEIVIITQSNFKEFVDIPSYIMDKLNSGIITITHFSDIMRACLLSKFGGVWFDATIYCVGQLENLENYSFYSNKLSTDKAKNFNYNVGKAQWSAFFLCCGKNNTILVNFKNILFEYWKTHTTLIDYFLVDYCIKLSEMNCISAKDMIDLLPCNNEHIHDLQPLLFDEFDEANFAELTKDCCIFKLTYKFEKEKANLINTYYRHITKK